MTEAAAYTLPTASLSTNRFTRFLICGAIAAAVNWTSARVLEKMMPFSVAVVVAYVIGMVVAFTLFRRYVFPLSPTPIARQILFFVLVNIAGLAQVWLVSMLLVTYALPALGHDGALWRSFAHGFAIGVPTLSSYIGHRFLTFRS